jgi:DNA-binding transcriptional LysR family regulator
MASEVELHEMEAFVTVAETLHFRAAAARLHTSQPVLSRTIARLERRLGVRLLDRSTRRVTLTEAGAAFLADAQRLLAGVQDAVARARQWSEPARLTVAVRPGTGQGALARIISAYREQFDGPVLDVHFTYTQEEALRDGTAQVAVTCQYEPLAPDLASLHVEDEEPVAVLPAGHPLAGRSAVTVAELQALPAYRPRAPLAGLDAVLDRVAMGLEVVIVGGSAVVSLRPSLAAVPVPDAPGASLRLAWLPERNDPVRDKFLAVARGILGD